MIICPIAMKTIDYSELLAYAEALHASLKAVGVRSQIDSRQVGIFATLFSLQFVTMNI